MNKHFFALVCSAAALAVIFKACGEIEASGVTCAHIFHFAIAAFLAVVAQNLWSDEEVQE